MNTGKLCRYFVPKQRVGGETFYTLADDRPQWLNDAVRDAHDNDFPCDWVYEVCYHACYAIDDGSLTVDSGSHEFADNEVDVYTRDLYRWAADMCLRSSYTEAEENARDMGAFDNPEGVHTILSTIQYCCIAKIADCIVHMWNDNCTVDSEAVAADRD
jgi:hypothetical protein